MTKKRDSGLSVLFIFVILLFAVILYNNLKEERTKEIPVICFIIDDFGYNLSNEVRGFIDLDIPITCSVLPGHPYSQKVAKLAYDARHQVMVHLPMETHDRRAGEEKFIITKSMSDDEIRSRVRAAFLEIHQAEGMNNHQGSLITENSRIMQILAEELKSLGKYFVDSRTTKETVAEQVMRSAGVPVDHRRVFLDNENSIRYIRKQIQQLAKIAKTEGVAIGIGHPRKKTLQAIKQEIPVLKRQGIHFGYASVAVR